MWKYYSRHYTWIILSLIISSKLNAQSKIEVKSDTIKHNNINEVKITGKTSNRKVKEMPFNLNVIDAKQFYNSSANINDALNKTTGVRIREDGGLGSSFNFSLNGFSGRQVKFFLDGLPMDNFGSSMTMNNLPATMADRIEIYKGVIPITLATDALGGAVNIVTRRDPNYLDVSYGFGSFNTHKVGVNGAYTNAKTGFTARTNVFYNYSDNNYKVNVRPIDLLTNLAGEEQEVKRFHDSYSSVGVQAEVGLTDKKFADQILIGAIISGNQKDIQTGVTMEQVFGGRTSNSNSIIPTLKYKKQNIFIDGLDFSLSSAYNLTTNNFIDTTKMRFNWLQQKVPTTAAELSRTQLKNKDNEGLTTANLAYHIDNNHSVSLNYLLTDFRRKSSDVEDMGNVTFTMPQKLRKQTLGLAWQATYQRFNVTAFSKFYFLHAESFENISTGSVPDYVATELDKTNAGYGIAGTYFITPLFQAKTSFERAYRLPESMELLGDGLFVRRNSNLAPEKSNNFNLGLLYSLLHGENHKLTLEGNFIYRDAKDYIRLDQQQTRPVDRQYINVGDVRTFGSETEIRYNWKDKFFVTLNGTYQNIIDKTPFIVTENLTGTSRDPNLNYNHRLPNMPYLFANANVGTRLQPSKTRDNYLGLNYNIGYVEKYFLTPNHIGLDNQDIIPRQISHDILADYSLDKGRYVVALECRNIYNDKLFDNYLLQKPGRSFYAKLRYFLN